MYAVYQPKRIKKTVQMQMSESITVAGVSFHQKEIGQAFRAEGETLWAVLEWETDNPHDPWAVRVSLIVKGKLVPCGHIPSALSEQFAKTVKDAADKKMQLAVNAEIDELDYDKLKYGVTLHRS